MLKWIIPGFLPFVILTTGNNLALASNGVKALADSSYSKSHNIIAINDGVKNGPGCYWAKVSWVSRAELKDHWVEVNFPEEVKVSQVKIIWGESHTEGKFFASKEFSIQKFDQGDWTEIEKIAENPQWVEFTDIILEPQKVKRLRIYQYKVNGPEEVEDTMQISEIEVY